MSLVDRPLPPWARRALRLPLLLYRVRLGVLLGHRFLVVGHRGRRTGKLHHTVVEVVRWDRNRREAVVVAGWGERSDWWRNLQAAPAVEVWLAGRRFVPAQRFVEPDEREAVLAAYRRRHPVAARLLGLALGLGGGRQAISAAALRLPMVAFREPPAAPAAKGRYLSVAEARSVYDRIGRFQDLQRPYEHRAVAALVAHADFGHASAVFELGHGTGAFARALLDRHLPPTARYVGLDVSPRMHELAVTRTGPWGQRATLILGDGSLPLPVNDAGFDRFVSCYVLDLLAPGDIDAVLGEAVRVVRPGGLMCLTSLTVGGTPLSRRVTLAWRRVWSLRPGLVGGCRPVRLVEHLDAGAWDLRHHAVVTSFGISSEVLVATRR